jgi:hypothetical protein
VRDGLLDKDSCQGHKGALQLWRGNSFLCGVSCYGGGSCDFYDTSCARVTVEKIVDSKPRDTAAARREAARERKADERALRRRASRGRV